MPPKKGPADPGKAEARKNMFALRAGYDNSAMDKGSKPTPKGSDVALQGLTFLVTGRMAGFDRDEILALVTKHGGMTRTGVSRALCYLVKGQDPGPSRMQKAEELGTTIIGEDDLLRLIAEKSELQGADAWGHIPGIDRNKWGGLRFAGLAASVAASAVVAPRAGGDNEVIILSDEEPAGATPMEVDGPAARPAVRAAPAAEAAEEKLWADKYAPLRSGDVLGNGGKAKELRDWLAAWKQNAKYVRENPKAKTDWKAGVLISGPPGIGKTTTSTLVARECGYDVVELNASDHRSKKSLHDHVSSHLGSRSLLTMFGLQPPSAPKPKPAEEKKDVVMIMDEVGGLDRGGTTEIIAMLKNPRTPIICICNDKYHQKLKSLSNHLLDMPFTRPAKSMIAAHLRKKLRESEGVDLHEQALVEVVEAAGNDIRATLNNLQMWCRTANRLSYEALHKAQASAGKDTDVSPFAAASELFKNPKLTIADAARLYYDNDLLGLFVQENYIYSGGNAGPARIDVMAAASRSLSEADMMDRTIRSENRWSLGPAAAFAAASYPTRILGQQPMTSYLPPAARQYPPVFPSYLGKLSRQNKNVRLALELTREATTKEGGMQGSAFGVVGEYVPTLRRVVEKDLCEGRVEAATETLSGYGMCKLDWEFAQEVDTWKRKGSANLAHPTIDTKTKSALTRALNKVQDSAAAKQRRGKVAAPTAEAEVAEDAEGHVGDDGDSASSDEEGVDESQGALVFAKAAKKAGAKAARKPSAKTCKKRAAPSDSQDSLTSNPILPPKRSRKAVTK